MKLFPRAEFNETRSTERNEFYHASHRNGVTCVSGKFRALCTSGAFSPFRFDRNANKCIIHRRCNHFVMFHFEHSTLENVFLERQTPGLRFSHPPKIQPLELAPRPVVAGLLQFHLLPSQSTVNLSYTSFSLTLPPWLPLLPLLPSPPSPPPRPFEIFSILHPLCTFIVIIIITSHNSHMIGNHMEIWNFHRRLTCLMINFLFRFCAFAHATWNLISSRRRLIVHGSSGRAVAAYSPGLIKQLINSVS